MLIKIISRSFLAILLTISATTASALSLRTFVSTKGVDNSTCSITSPCRLTSTAIGVTTDGGEVVMLDSGGFGSNINVTKSITLISPPGVYTATAVTSGSGIVINSPGVNVTIRGINFVGTGAAAYGVNIIDAASVSIENCTFTGFQSAGVNLLLTNPGSKVAVTESKFTNNNIGILADNNARVLVNQSKLMNNAYAIVLFPSIDGLSAAADIVDTTMSGNDYGLFASTSNGPSISVTFNANHITTNDGSYGVVVTGAGAFGLISNSNAIGNSGDDFNSSGGATLSSAGNNVVGNVGGDSTFITVPTWVK